MGKNWIIEEAKKVDGSKDVVTLENPETKAYLDRILLEKFWPTICSCFEGSDYNYSLEPHLESELSFSLERSITFVPGGTKTFIPRLMILVRAIE